MGSPDTPPTFRGFGFFGVVLVVHVDLHVDEGDIVAELGLHPGSGNVNDPAPQRGSGIGQGVAKRRTTGFFPQTFSKVLS